MINLMLKNASQQIHSFKLLKTAIFIQGFQANFFRPFNFQINPRHA